MLRSESPGLIEAGPLFQELAISVSTFADTGVTSQEHQAELPYDAFHKPALPSDVRSWYRKIRSMEKFAALASFLGSTPNLRILDVHF